jgi:cell division protein ZapA (FtsZ GTPase activity inhibitor)
MVNSKQYEFDVLGQKIVIKNDEEATLAELAIGLVDEKINDLKISHPNYGPQQLSVLALLELAGSMIKDRKAIDEYRHELDRKCSSLLVELDGIKKNTSH